MTTTIDCAAFDDEVTDLALGFTAEPARSALLAHAAGCARCASPLEELGRTVDALVELTPEAEPPAGFESRAIAAMRPPAAVTPFRRRAGGRWVAAAAVAAVFLVLVGVAAGARWREQNGGDLVAAPSGLVRTADGDVLGRVELASSPSPRVVVVLEGPYDWRGTWTCELRRPDGSWVEVGRWASSDAPTGAWSAPIAGDLVHATAMRITAGDHVVATSDRLD
jgi:hypothetical protein